MTRTCRPSLTRWRQSSSLTGAPVGRGCSPGSTRPCRGCPPCPRPGRCSFPGCSPRGPCLWLMDPGRTDTCCHTGGQPHVSAGTLARGTGRPSGALRSLRRSQCKVMITNLVWPRELQTNWELHQERRHRYIFHLVSRRICHHKAWLYRDTPHHNLKSECLCWLQTRSLSHARTPHLPTCGPAPSHQSPPWWRTRAGPCRCPCLCRRCKSHRDRWMGTHTAHRCFPQFCRPLGTNDISTLQYGHCRTHCMSWGTAGRPHTGPGCPRLRRMSGAPPWRTWGSSRTRPACTGRSHSRGAGRGTAGAQLSFSSLIPSQHCNYLYSLSCLVLILDNLSSCLLVLWLFEIILEHVILKACEGC